MPTETLRATHMVTQDYSDLVTSIPGAAGAGGFVRHLGGADVEIIKGGAVAPAETVRGIPLRDESEGEWCEADHIWVRCRRDMSAKLAFEVVS